MPLECCTLSYKLIRRINIFTPIEPREPVSQKVAGLIEDAIRERKIKPDEKLPSEAGLCEQFGVSRTVVREALKMLMAKGLVHIEKGKGVFVKRFSPENIIEPFHTYLQMEGKDDYVLDVLEARMIIEPSIAAYAAMYHTEEDVEKLKNDIIEMQQSIGDSARHAKADVTFHLDIAIASKNPFMYLILAPIHRMMPKIKTKILEKVQDAHESAVIWHGKIFEAIVERNADKAFKTMEEHLKIAKEHTEKMLKPEVEPE